MCLSIFFISQCYRPYLHNRTGTAWRIGTATFTAHTYTRAYGFADMPWQHSQSLSRIRLFLIAANSLSYTARISVSIVPNPSLVVILKYVPLCGWRIIPSTIVLSVIPPLYYKIVQICVIEQIWWAHHIKTRLDIY